MGATGAIIMSFFGGVFAASTLATRLGWSGPALVAAFVPFAVVVLAAFVLHRRPGPGFVAPAGADRVILWSSIGEGVGLGVAANLVTNLGYPDLLLPAIATVVGLHFLPMGYAIPFRPFYFLGGALLAAAAIGFALPVGGAVIAGASGAVILWVASALAIDRERRAKLG